MWLDANALPAVFFHVGTSTTTKVLYVLQPSDSTWKTSGSWAAPVALSGTMPVGCIDASVKVVSGVFHLVYTN